MSTNIHVYADREVIVVKTGKMVVQTIIGYVWQTPSNVTREILNSADRLEAYTKWILDQSEDCDEPIYDVVTDEIVGTRKYNPGAEHIADLMQWINQAIDDGYNVRWEAW